MKKIIFIIPYFGKLPFWMPYFLVSCKFNPTINWIIITDQRYEMDIPKNVKFIYKTYASYCKFVSKKLDINFNPPNPYKLCDIKPSLGYVHSDLVAGYDFWAFGDLDLIYGDLRAYFTEDRLAKKSLFSTHATRISGHLCLIKNHRKLNEAFMRVKNWKSIFENDRHYAFDEKNFSKLFIKHKNLPQILRRFAKLFNPWLRLGEFVEAYSTPNAKVKWVDGSYNFPSEWLWVKGTVTNVLEPNKKFPYLHFMIWKSLWTQPNFRFSVLEEKFCITKLGFKNISC
jgi:hypothetical protein